VMLVDPGGDTISFNFFAKFISWFKRSVLHQFADTYVKTQTKDNVFFVFAHGNTNFISFTNEAKKTGVEHGVTEPMEIINRLKKESPSFKEAMDNNEPLVLYIMSCKAARNSKGDSNNTNLVKEISKKYPNMTVVGADGNVSFSRDKINGVTVESGGSGFFAYKGGNLVAQKLFIYDKKKSITAGSLLEIETY
jgi:hypothetical protein